MASEQYCKAYVRNQFSVTGTLDTIKEHDIYEDVKRHARKNNMRVNDYMWNMIGINPTKNLGEEEVVKAIGYLYYNEENKFKKLANSKGVGESVLRDEVGKLTVAEKYVQKTTSPEGDLLAEYIKTESKFSLAQEGNNEAISLSDMAKEIKSLSYKGRLDAVRNLTKRGMQKTLAEKLLTVNEKAKSVRYIGVTERVLYGVKKEDLEDFYENALYRLADIEFIVSDEIRKVLQILQEELLSIDCVHMGVTEKFEKFWKTMVHVSLYYKTPISKVLQNSGYIMNDFSKTYTEDILVCSTMNSSVHIVQNKMCENAQEYIVTNKHNFIQLFEKDILKDIVFDEEGYASIKQTGERIADVLNVISNNPKKVFV